MTRSERSSAARETFERHLVLGPDGPEGWAVGDHPFRRLRAGQPVRSVQTRWERLELGTTRLQDGTVSTPGKTRDVPVALRLDFDAGPVRVVGTPPDTDANPGHDPG